MATPRDDRELLRAYAERRDEAAFAELVARHADMVYAAALRQVGRARCGMVEDVTQAAFVLLARNAGRIAPAVVIAGWLHKATRYAALNAMRMEQRRREHERRAGEQQAAGALRRGEGAAGKTPVVGEWAEGAALLDEGISHLGSRDREAIVLRFLERRSYGEISRSLGVSEEAAQMRVSRAIEKLRAFFRRRGLIVAATSLRAAVNASAVVPAPGPLKVKLAAGALRGASAGRGAVPIADAAGRSMAWAARRADAFAFAASTAAAAAVTLLLLRFLVAPSAQAASNRTPTLATPSQPPPEAVPAQMPPPASAPSDRPEWVRRAMAEFDARVKSIPDVAAIGEPGK